MVSINDQLPAFPGQCSGKACFMNPLASLFRRRVTCRRRSTPLRAEALEPRTLLATFTVTNLLNAGAGSLRAAINQANANPGADEIAFAVVGTVPLSTALPAITDAVSIDGSTAPGFVGSPQLTVNFRGRTGLRFAPGSDGSSLTSLALVRARGAGVTLDASGITLAGNSIGVLANGTTAAPNTGAGVLVTARGSANQIGTSADGGSNLISGNRGAGVRILGDANVVAWNLIGTTSTGAAALANGGDGVRLEAGATGNLVGHADPVTSIDYFNTSEITTDTSLPVESWTGIRGLANGDYLITGSTESGGVQSGLLYVGTLDGGDGDAYAINYPGGSGTATSVYGPDDLGNGEVLLVGTYVLAGDETRYGFAFRGNLATMATDVLNPANYETIWNGSEFNYLHSTMGGLAVGNSITSNTPNERGRAYIYDFQTQQFTDIVFPGTISNTAYGIWDNGDGGYTIAGGFSQLPVNNADDRLQPIGMASLIDYDRATGTFSNWRAYSYQSPDQVTAGTHFMGISSVEKGVYTLSGTGFVSGTIESSGLATVVRQTDGSFGDMAWVELDPPESVTGVSGLPSANSVYGNAVVGIVLGESSSASYQAEVNVGSQLSNVISGNRGNGIGIYGANANRVAMNNIGTSFAGTAAVPNRANGILVTNRERQHDRWPGDGRELARVVQRLDAGLRPSAAGQSGLGQPRQRRPGQWRRLGQHAQRQLRGHDALGDRNARQWAGRRGDRRCQRQQPDRHDLPAESVRVLQRALRQPWQRPADHQLQRHDRVGQFHGARGQQRHDRGERRQRAAGLGHVAADARGRSDPDGQRRFGQQPARHRNP